MALKLLSDEDRIAVVDAELVEDGDPATSYTLRKMTPLTQRQIIKKNTKAGNYKRGETIDSYGVMDDQLDHVLIAWTGVTLDGRDVPCTRENKLLLDAYRIQKLLERALVADVVALEDARSASFRPTA